MNLLHPLKKTRLGRPCGSLPCLPALQLGLQERRPWESAEETRRKAPSAATCPGNTWDSLEGGGPRRADTTYPEANRPRRQHVPGRLLSARHEQRLTYGLHAAIGPYFPECPSLHGSGMVSAQERQLKEKRGEANVQGWRL